ncbi:MAG: response regulator transcription factor [Clostridia bacterium]|nr:response regulator transcription factor [Clostridia bacterium]
MADKSRILIVDDEADIRRVLRLLLERRGYEVREATNGQIAVDTMHDGGIDLVIMDIMMPYVSGIDAASKIREFSTAPILFLTAKSLDRDKTAAYKSGGDDYLVKPFSSTELILKVESLIRRYTVYRGKETESGLVLLPCSVEVDLTTKTVFKSGEEVNLRDKENDIFFYLLTRRGETVETDKIYEGVWGEMAMPSSANNVMVNMLNIRKKLEDNPQNPKIIKTVWGKGYRID